MAWRLGQERLHLVKVLLMGCCLVFTAAEDPNDCREQEYKDQSGICVPCKQCDAGQELSKECGFGYGEDAQCVACRPGRFREHGGQQKCKPCLSCALLNRSRKHNCSSTRNAVCGDCLPGFYRKTKLSGFQDMECVPCGDPPPPYEPHCSTRVNLVPLQARASSPRDVALAAVICSALASVLLALLILCVIYCKRQLLEKKLSALMRSQDGPYRGEALLCLDHRRVHKLSPRACRRCSQAPGQTRGPTLIPATCCDDTCSLGLSRDTSLLQSQGELDEGLSHPLEGSVPGVQGSLVGYPGNPAERRTFTRASPSPKGRDPLPSDHGLSDGEEQELTGPLATSQGVQPDCNDAQDLGSPGQPPLHLERPPASSS